jgi:hypothetical protein
MSSLRTMNTAMGLFGGRWWLMTVGARIGCC